MNIQTDFRNYSFSEINNLSKYIANPLCITDKANEKDISDADIRILGVFKKNMDNLHNSIDRYNPAWWQRIIDLFTFRWYKLYRLRSLVPRVQDAFNLVLAKQEALRFANEMEKITIPRTPYKPRGELLIFEPPERIWKLINVYEMKNEELIQSLKDCKHNQTDPWKDEKVIKQAKECVMLAYQINYESLEDLPRLKDKVAEFYKNKTNENKLSADYTPRSLMALRNTNEEKVVNFLKEYEAFQSYDSYIEKSFYFTVDMYFFMRGQIFLETDPNLVERHPLQRPFLRYDLDKIKQDVDYAKPFYEPGTWQNKCRLLFNDYGYQVRSKTVMDMDTHIYDRHLNWIKPDLTTQSFNPFCGSRST